MAKSQSNEGKDIFSLERLRQLIDLMKEHDLGEIDLQQDAQRIRLTRGSLPTMPNSKNYVEVGSTIQPDTTICIIEAMKVFNEIPAEVRGKIVSVLVQNEEAVDFGRPLFKVDTRG